jgi:hypothetical protein
MRWLERLRSLEEKINILEAGTAKTAESPFYSFCGAASEDCEVSHARDEDRGRQRDITTKKADTSHPPSSSATDPTRCAWCGEGERSGAMIVPFGTETTGHTWLHSGCWREWYAKRRGETTPADAPVTH